MFRCLRIGSALRMDTRETSSTSRRRPSGEGARSWRPQSATICWLLPTRQWAWRSDFWHRNERPIVLGWLAEVPDVRRVLDAGTGTGTYLADLAAKNLELAGVDISTRMIDAARRKLGGRARLHVADIRQMPFGPDEFDLALCCRVLSHVQDPRLALSEIRRVTREGGYLLLSDVDGHHDYACTNARVDGRQVSIATHKHTADELARALDASGFDLVRSETVTFDRLKWQPPPGSFQSIDRLGARPVFLVMLARARG